MLRRRPSLIVFDLDGTLIDTAPDLIDTLNVVLGNERLPPVAYDEARLMIGGGARRMLELGLKADGRATSGPELDRMFNEFLKYYSAHIADRSRPFPGLESALDALEPERERLAALIGTAPTLRDLRRFASKGFDGATLEDLASALGFDEAA